MSVYEVITQRIIDQLKQGVVAWHKPWTSAGLPKNLVSGKQYRGINVFMLIASGYDSPYWVTFKQAKDLGGSVRKGEHGTPIVFWSVNNKPVENPESHEIENERHFVARYYVVFNYRQCENLPALPEENHQPVAPIAECEHIVADWESKPAIEYGFQFAAYSKIADKVMMPHLCNFHDPAEMYSTLFHELTHSTGHPSRLNRATLTDSERFGDREYSKEELVAELGAAFLCGISGIENKAINNSASYIANWLQALQNDSKLVIVAAAQAQKAADFITGKDYSHEQTEQQSELIAA